MAEEVYPMTQEGLEKIQQDLDELKIVKRKEIVERIKIARSYGDLSENSEYEAAKDEQAFVEGQIQKLEKMVRYAKIIDPNEIDEGIVSLGRKVTFIELPDGDEEVYSIVGRAEADPLDGKISNESPIGQALLGKKRNNVVEVQAPAGIIKLKILSIKK